MFAMSWYSNRNCAVINNNPTLTCTKLLSYSGIQPSIKMRAKIVINNNYSFVCITHLLGMGLMQHRCKPFLILYVCVRQFDGTVYKQVNEKNDCATWKKADHGLVM